MPSPFPGMDPYLEHPAFWRELHNKLAYRIQDALNSILPQPYVATLEPSIEIGILDAEVSAHLISPDVAVEERPEPPGTQPAAVAIMPAPLELTTTLGEEIRVIGVRVLHLPSNQLVTVIEILSPINKRPGSKACEDYLAKRDQLQSTRIHLLEIDLLRQGQRVPMAESLPDAPFFIILGRGHRRPICEVWPLQLSDPLPTVPVPLLPGDPDVPLDLAAVFRESYESSRFGDRIDYRQQPPGPLTDAQRAWIEILLAGQGFRES